MSAIEDSTTVNDLLRGAGGWAKASTARAAAGEGVFHAPILQLERRWW
jgi:hypothetical protein